MKVKATVEGSDVTKGIRFYGDTSYDEEVVEKIDELHEFLFHLFLGLNEVEKQVEGRDEASAKEIDQAIRKMKTDLKETFFTEEDN